MATLDIITVNWNAGKQLRAALESVVKSDLQHHKLLRVVVVDNASSDHSADNLGDLGLPLQVIQNKENLGFGTACNQGARESAADYIVLLNPDVRLEKHALSCILDFMDDTAHQHIGIVGGQLLNEEGTVITRTCANFLRPSLILNDGLGLSKLFPKYFPGLHMTNWDHKDSRVVDHVIGAFCCIRRAIFEAVGGFDEKFFMYLEDLDLSLRVHQLGKNSYYFTEAKGFHRGGGTTEQVKAKRLAWSLQSRLRYARKHFSWWQYIFVLLITLVLEPIPRLIYAILHRSRDEIINTLHGYLLLFSYLLIEMMQIDRTRTIH